MNGFMETFEAVYPVLHDWAPVLISYAVFSAFGFQIVDALQLPYVHTDQYSWEPGVIYMVRACIIALLAPVVLFALMFGGACYLTIKDIPGHVKWLFTPPGDTE